MEPAGRLRESDVPARYRRPCRLAGYPCQRMSIRWKKPVAGPVSVGAGIGYGLGLFLPTRIKDPAPKAARLTGAARPLSSRL